jgi:hypothetical protein
MNLFVKGGKKFKKKTEIKNLIEHKKHDTQWLMAHRLDFMNQIHLKRASLRRALKNLLQQSMSFEGTGA